MGHDVWLGLVYNRRYGYDCYNQALLKPATRFFA